MHILLDYLWTNLTIALAILVTARKGNNESSDNSPLKSIGSYQDPGYTLSAGVQVPKLGRSLANLAAAREARDLGSLARALSERSQNSL